MTQLRMSVGIRFGMRMLIGIRSDVYLSVRMPVSVRIVIRISFGRSITSLTLSCENFHDLVLGMGFISLFGHSLAYLVPHGH